MTEHWVLIVTCGVVAVVGLLLAHDIAVRLIARRSSVDPPKPTAGWPGIWHEFRSGYQPESTSPSPQSPKPPPGPARSPKAP